jgi:hypothetical protein
MNKSQILMDALGVMDPSVKRKVTLPAPKEWLQAWADCYCSEEDRMSREKIKDLVHCLLVRSFAPGTYLQSCTPLLLRCNCVHGLLSAKLSDSSLFGTMHK